MIYDSGMIVLPEQLKYETEAKWSCT